MPQLVLWYETNKLGGNFFKVGVSVRPLFSTDVFSHSFTHAVKVPGKSCTFHCNFCKADWMIRTAVTLERLECCRSTA